MWKKNNLPPPNQHTHKEKEKMKKNQCQYSQTKVFSNEITIESFKTLHTKGGGCVSESNMVSYHQYTPTTQSKNKNEDAFHVLSSIIWVLKREGVGGEIFKLPNKTDGTNKICYSSKNSNFLFL